MLPLVRVESVERGRIVVFREFLAGGRVVNCHVNSVFIIPDYGWRMVALLERTTRSLCTLFVQSYQEPSSIQSLLYKIVYLFANQWY